jgi:hypothetical protein
MIQNFDSDKMVLGAFDESQGIFGLRWQYLKTSKVPRLPKKENVSCLIYSPHLTDEITVGVHLNPSQWLKTETAATQLIKKIRNTSQLTVGVIVASLDACQKGPARILSISKSPYDRNFTLAQKGSNLSFRLRTRVTGKNGDRPEIVIPNVFGDSKYHHIIVTYDGRYLLFYLDTLDPLYSLDMFGASIKNLRLFSSKFLLFSSGSYIIDIAKDNLSIYRAFYFAILFIPLGSIVALLLIRLTCETGARFLVLVFGTVLPALALELTLTCISGSEMRWQNVFFGFSTTIITALLLKIWLKTWLTE